MLIETLRYTVSVCMGKGKLPIHVAINMGRLPLTPEKQVGYHVER